MAPKTPTMFISPKRAPTWRPLMPMAHDHQSGWVDWAAKQESAVKPTAIQGSRIRRAQPSRAAAAKKAAPPRSATPARSPAAPR